jgi:hypothetical protein
MPRRLINPLSLSRAVLGSAAAAVLLTVAVAPASADRLRVTDARGDMTGVTESSEGVTATPAPDHRAGDVTSIVVRHRRHAVTMKVSFAQLRRSHFNGFFGRLRTDAVSRQFVVEDQRNARPRLYVVNKRFRPVCRSATLHVDYQANTLAIRVPRTCLERPEWVKARAMSANDKADGSNTYYLDDAFSRSPVEGGEGRGAWSARVHRR